jgi:hypothetical protein
MRVLPGRRGVAGERAARDSRRRPRDIGVRPIRADPGLPRDSSRSIGERSPTGGALSLLLLLLLLLLLMMMVKIMQVLPRVHWCGPDSAVPSEREPQGGAPGFRR